MGILSFSGRDDFYLIPVSLQFYCHLSISVFLLPVGLRIKNCNQCIYMFESIKNESP